MAREPRFILNVNDGVDTVHDTRYLTESCNTDDIDDRQNVDVRTAAKLIATGQAVACAHCSGPAHPSEA